MKKIKFQSNVFEAEKIVKKNDSIIGYNGKKEVFVFNGISDFSLFILIDGEDFDSEEINKIDELRLQMARSNSDMFEMFVSLMNGGL